MIEPIRPQATAAHARVALFDFDGTLSLIRSGWVDVMVPMMVEILADLKTGESEAELRAMVEDFVWRSDRQRNHLSDDGVRRSRRAAAAEARSIRWNIRKCTSTCCGSASAAASTN